MTGAATEFADRKAVVTGGLGLIGSRLAQTIADAGAEVVVVDALIPEHGGNRNNLSPRANVVIVEHDLRDGARLPELLDGAAVVFNLAGQRSHSDSMRDPVTDLEHNCRAQLVLLEACRRFAPEATVVFASTRQVYGRTTGLSTDEGQPIRPCDVNGIHAAAAEQYHALYEEIYGLPTVTLRLTNTYGPGMRVCDSRQGFLGAWIGAVVRGHEFEVWDGSQRRDFNYVDDVVDALVLAAAEPRARGRVYNLGGDEPTSLREVADLLVHLHGSGSYRVIPMPVEARSIDIGDYAGDYRAFASLVGWKPAVPLADGLARTLSFYSEHGDRYWDGAR